MRKVIVAVMMLAVLMVGSVAGANPGGSIQPLKGGANALEHGTILPFEHGTIQPFEHGSIWFE